MQPAAHKGRGKGCKDRCPVFDSGVPRHSERKRTHGSRKRRLDELVAAAQADFGAAADAAELENAKARYLGKTGRVTELMKGLGKLDRTSKERSGAVINVAKASDRGRARPRAARRWPNAELQAQLKAEALDVTLPGRGRGQGGIHPVMRTLERIEQIFRSIGFDVADGPEIETDWNNFTALNNPENHPARSMQDTFYVEGEDSTGKPLLLRTAHQPDAGALRHAARAATRRRRCPRSA